MTKVIELASEEVAKVIEVASARTKELIYHCTSSTRPSAPAEGQHIYETDTDKTLKNVGTTESPNWKELIGEDEFAAHLAEKATEGINVLYPGYSLTAMVADGTTDNTSAFQAIINYAHDNNINKVLIPFGEYLIKGTITLKKNVQIIGVPDNYNAYCNVSSHVDYASMVRILHVPDNPNTDLFVTDSVQTYGYISGISIANLDVFGDNTNSRYAFDLVNPANLEMKNVLTKRFSEGLRINASINCKFSHVDIQYSTVVCVRFHTGISTSTTFHNCYFHFSPTPLIMEQETGLGITFCDQTIFESCDDGLDIYPGNVVDFTNCYAENIPSDGSAKAILNLGINGVAESGYARGNCSITGGVWGGYNSGADAGSSIFNLDKWAMLSVTGTKLLRAGNTVLKTANTKGVILIGIMEQGITNGVFNSTLQTGIIALGSNYVGTFNNALGINQIRFNGRGKWKISESFTQTDGDLTFEVGGAKPFWLDANQNIRHQFTGNQSTTGKADLYGAVATPSFGTLATALAVWGETVNSDILLRVRTATGKLGFLGPVSGTTVQRPTTLVSDGATYYDTDLGKPIWKKDASTTKWVDATGADA